MIELKERNRCILLISPGWPEGEDDVSRYIRQILTDPNTMNLPFGRMLSFPLASMIAFFRSRRVIKKYNMVGAYDLFKKNMEKVARSVERKLRTPVEVANRYSKPTIESVIERLGSQGIEHIVCIPMNPQFSISTNGSFIESVMLSARRAGVRASFVTSFYSFSEFIDLCAKHIKNCLKDLSVDGNEIDRFSFLFAAHSVPRRNLKLGDPYRKHTEEMTRRIADKIGIGNRAYLGYQSKVGPIKWVGPDLREKVKQICHSERNEGIVVFPLSFVVENLETTFDLDVELKSFVIENGMEKFIRIPCIGESSDFSDFIAEVAERIM